jgi:hypothetical protein
MNIFQAKQVIEAADVCGHVPLIRGLHGIGKSESAAQYAKEQDMHYEPLILSLMDTGDMLGLPEIEKVGGVTSTIWAAPSWYTNIVNAAWPEAIKLHRLQFTDTDFQTYVLDNTYENPDYISREHLNSLYCKYYKLPNDRIQLLRQQNVEYLDGRRSLLNLDEFNRAPADILNASLQLILDHRLHTHILPLVRGQETLIVAAVNPADGDYTVQEFDPALQDRFVICDVDPDFKAWLSWAKSANVNKIVIDFLIDNQNRFHTTPKDGTKGASPRSWTRLAKYMDRLKDTPQDVMTHYVKGTVGSSLAAQFISFYNNYSNNISTKDIITAVKKEVTKLKKAKKPLNPEEIALPITEMVENLEAVRRSDFAETLIKQFINEESTEKAMPMLAFLYALPLESLSAVLKTLQNNNIQHYATLANLDKEANNKGLFVKLVSKVKEM